MSKLNKIRIFIKDGKNNYYRICSISNPKDKKGEHYLKIMFPDIKGIPLFAGYHDRGMVKTLPGLAMGVQEFSYHYRSGALHFKNSKGYVDLKRNMPTLIGYPALHLLRYIIRSVDFFEIQDKSKIGSGDFILPNAFSNAHPRGFELAVARVAGRWNVINDQGKDPINTYKLSLEDPNVSFHISDGIWRRPPMGKSDTLFEIFTYDNPVESFSFIPLSKRLVSKLWSKFFDFFIVK